MIWLEYVRIEFVCTMKKCPTRTRGIPFVYAHYMYWKMKAYQNVSPGEKVWIVKPTAIT